MNRIKFFMATTIDEVEKMVNDFLERENCSIISFNEIHRYNSLYCICLVYKTSGERKPYERC